MLNGKTILVTGGTGSFGKKFTRMILERYQPKKVIIYSRDEFKQWQMAEEFKEYAKTLRFFIGDVRDAQRLQRALNGVDYVIHAAAMKQVPACEYNPMEAVKTNIDGAMNIINCAIDAGVKKVVALSTDKSVNPVNLYGATKMVSDKLFVAGNAYSGWGGTIFSVVRYGNVAGSRGSVIPFFKQKIESGEKSLPITDYRMTRFWIDLSQGVELVLKALKEARGGEIFISKIPSFKITDLAQAMLPGCDMPEIGIREGEKLHEVMVSKEDASNTFEFENHYIIYPQIHWENQTLYDVSKGKRVPVDFEYNSGNNTQWLSIEELKKLLHSRF